MMLRICFLIIWLAWFMFLPSRAIREKCTFSVLHFNHLQSAVKSQSLSVVDGLSIVIKFCLFPCFLITYFLYLLIDQTHIFNLHFHYLFLITDASWLLWMTIVSWIVSVLIDKKNWENRTVQYSSSILWRSYYVFCWFLWILGSVILYNQIFALTQYAYIIATTAWIGLILIGFILVEEQE